MSPDWKYSKSTGLFLYSVGIQKNSIIGLDYFRAEPKQFGDPSLHSYQLEETMSYSEITVQVSVDTYRKGDKLWAVSFGSSNRQIVYQIIQW